MPNMKGVPSSPDEPFFESASATISIVKTAVFLIRGASCARAAGIPMTLVSEDEAEPIHSAIVRKEAWTQDSVRRLRADADRRMKEGPWTVTSDRPKGAPRHPRLL